MKITNKITITEKPNGGFEILVKRFGEEFEGERATLDQTCRAIVATWDKAQKVHDAKAQKKS